MKKMILKTAELFNMREQLRPMVSNNQRAFPGKFAYILSKNYKTLSSALEAYDDTQKNLLTKIQENGHLEVNENGAIRITDPEEFKNYMAEINEIQSVEVEVSLVTMSRDEFEKILDRCDFAVAEIEVLENMIEDKEA